MYYLVVLWISLLGYSFCYGSQPITLASGEYAPFSGEKLSAQGLSTAILKASFAEVGYTTINLRFLPWSRGYKMAQKNEVDGTFPYAWNAERDQAFLYSAPILISKLFYYVRPTDKAGLTGIWNKKVLCHPLGWTDIHIKLVIEKFKLHMVRPATLEQCIKMIDKKRADLISLDEYVAKSAFIKNFNSPAVLAPSLIEQQSNTLYFIISRSHPHGQKIITDFNRGLATIRANNRHQQIIQKTIKQIGRMGIK